MTIQIIEYPFQMVEAKLMSLATRHHSDYSALSIIATLSLMIIIATYVFLLTLSKLRPVVEQRKSLVRQNRNLLDILSKCKVSFGTVDRENKLLSKQIDEQYHTLLDLQKEKLRDAAILNAIRRQNDQLELQLKSEEQNPKRQMKDLIELSDEIRMLKWYEDRYLEVMYLAQGSDPDETINMFAFVLNLQNQVFNLQESNEELKMTLDGKERRTIRCIAFFRMKWSISRHLRQRTNNNVPN